MNIRQLTDNIRYKMKYGSTVEWYNFWYIVLRRRQKVIPQVASIDETIRQIASERCSVSRFGDGEILLTQASKNIGFQKGDPALAERLKEVLKSHEQGHLVCVSDVFQHLERYNRKARRFWRTHFSFTARGGTVYWFQDENITTRLSLVPTWTSLRNKIADDGSEP